ncbi:hypothetical protein WJX72_000791 [[Myrmecia] bisecta]|uniref:ubiquitinyl hydrolase 1 n=1 Tax=[Myrmecia] bisecta TaxID=41462 RepID=A0AAW1R4W6_9CHLO
MATPLCPMCNKPARQRCSLCKSVRYCSVKCQGEHWSYGHKEECRRGAVVAKKAAHRNGSLDACTAANGAALPAHEQQEEAPVPKQELFAYSGYLQLLRESQALDMPVPCGIRNTGNSCFAAAVLQCLLYTHPLPAFFSQRLHSQRCIRPKPQAWCALCALEALANAAYGQQEGGAISADSILQHIRKLGSHFAVGEQEDCHELLVQLQDAMQGIMLREAGGRERHPEVRTQETTLVHHIFSGYMRQQTICGSCGYVSKSFENTSALQLSIPPGVFDIEAALALDTKPEKLDEHNKWKCDHCKEHVHARRDLKVEIAPNVLQICLKRFTGYNGKIEKLIDFGETLDLTPFMACGAIDDQPVTYSLYGVITHIGRGSSTAFGHYICFVRTEPDNWFRPSGRGRS